MSCYHRCKLWEYAPIRVYIAYRVNVTDTARSLLHERTQTGAPSTVSVVALQASLVCSGHLTYHAWSKLEGLLPLHIFETSLCVTTVFMTFV
jgi:hypothetical protein